MKDVNIYCQAYDWDASVQISDCNFHSGEAYDAIGPTIDLKEFMLDTDSLKLRYDFDETMEDNTGQQSLFFTASDVEMTLSDWKPLSDGSRLRDYFYLFLTSSTYDRIKFLVKIYRSGVLIFQGVIPRDVISEKFTGMNDDRTIKLSIMGWEKEARDYYKTQELIGFGSLAFTYVKPSGSLVYAELRDVLEGNFPNDTINIPESNIEDWRVTEFPEMWLSATSNPLYFPRCGYRQIQNEYEKRFDWLYKLCMSMGWIFYYFPNGTDMELNIKNRYSFDSGIPIKQIDAKNIISMSASKQKDNIDFDYVIILNGTMIGGDGAFPNGHSTSSDHRGERLHFVSEKTLTDYDWTNYGLHFSSVSVSLLSNYSFVSVTNDKFIKYYNENDSQFTISQYTYSSSSANAYTNYTLNKENILFLNCGHNATVKRRINLTGNGEADWRSGDPYGNTDLIYSGCYGEMLYQQNGSDPYHYQDYVKGTAFNDIPANQLFNNYKKFTRKKNNNLVLNVTVNEFIIDPMQIVQFVNTTEIPYTSSSGNKWCIVSLEADLVNDTTNLNLIGNS